VIFCFCQVEGLIRLLKILLVLALGRRGMHARVEEESSYGARNGFGELAEVT